MPNWFIINMLVLVLVIVLTGFIIPQILLIAFRKKLYDDPDQRKVHTHSIPRLGGIAFFPAILFTLLLTVGLSQYYTGGAAVRQELYGHLTTFCLFVSAVVVLYLVGMADDLIGVRFRAKFVAQFAAGCLVIIGGLQYTDLNGIFWLGHLPHSFGVMFTALMIVFITNAVNLIDGIDGLASGLSAIACMFFGYLCYRGGDYLHSMLAYATLGALLPFFYYNVFGNAQKHSKIFMGDTGSLTIGLILSVLSIRVCASESLPHDLNPTVAAFAPMLIPCLDVVRVFLRRLRERRAPFLPDKTHIHHKLLHMGMPQRVAMPTIVGVSLCATLVNYALSVYVDITLLFVADVAAWIAANMAINRFIRSRNRRLAAE